WECSYPSASDPRSAVRRRRSCLSSESRSPPRVTARDINKKKWDWLPLESGPGQPADGALLDLLSWQARHRPPLAIRFPDGPGPTRLLNRIGGLLPYLPESLSFRLPPSQAGAHRAPQRGRL